MLDHDIYKIVYPTLMDIKSAVNLPVEFVKSISIYRYKKKMSKTNNSTRSPIK